MGADCDSLKLPPQDDFQKRFPPPWRLCMWLGSALAPGPGGPLLPKACRRGACGGHTAEDSQTPRMLLPSGQGPGLGAGGGVSRSVMSDSYDPMDCSLPGSSVHGILQARILEGAAISFSKGIFLTQESNPGLLHCRQSLPTRLRGK